MHQPRSSAQISTQQSRSLSSSQVKPAKSKRQQSHTRKPLQQADKRRKKVPEAAGRKVSATNHAARTVSSPVPPETPTKEITTQNYRRSPPEEKGPLIFQGELRFPNSNRAARAWISELLDLADSSPNPVVVGFDSETPVVWKNSANGTRTMLHGQTVALLQLCYHPPSSTQSWPICVLVHLSSLGFKNKGLEALLEHPNIIKVGMNITQDIAELQRDYDEAARCQPQGLVDLDYLAKTCGVSRPLTERDLAHQQKNGGLKTFPRPQLWGLASLLGHTTGYSLPKGKAQLSNWARLPLTEKQLEYACADALASLVCCMALRVQWLQRHMLHQTQQELLLQQDEQLELPALLDPLHMGAWELSKGGSFKFQKDTQGAVQPWNAVLQQCCGASAWALDRWHSNARAKDELSDPLDWQLGWFYEPDSARGGYQDSPW